MGLHDAAPLYTFLSEVPVCRCSTAAEMGDIDIFAMMN